eukprot:SAG25_NODE_4741_length_757_cov_0.986322_2_plen_144_part_01
MYCRRTWRQVGAAATAATPSIDRTSFLLCCEPPPVLIRMTSIVDPALAHRDAKHDAETGRWSLSARARASGNWSGNRVGATDFTCADPSQQCTERQAAAAPWFVCPCPHLGFVGAVALAWSSCVVLVYACMVLALDPHARNSVY